MTILIPFQLLVNILLLNGARLSVPSHTLPWLGVNAVAIGLYMVSGIIVYLYLDNSASNAFVHFLETVDISLQKNEKDTKSLRVRLFNCGLTWIFCGLVMTFLQ